jgi:DNA-binding MarR family transcriptional regulator
VEETRQDEEPLSRRILHDLGFFGHYLHVHAGGRSGKQHILAKLHQAGGKLSQRELQERSHISSAALSEVLSKLEMEGLVTRSRSDEDRRQMDITLTEEGVTQAIMRKREFEAFESECLSCLSEDERIQLLEMLDRLAELWRGMDGKEACA